MTSVITTRRSRGLWSGKSGCPPASCVGIIQAPASASKGSASHYVAVETSCTQVEPTVTPITFSWFSVASPGVLKARSAPLNL